MLVIQNTDILDRLHSRYGLQEIRELRDFLEERGVFHVPVLDNGLFPAAEPATADAAQSGYEHVWVRDNVHIALAHYVAGHREAALKNASALAAYFRRNQRRFRNIILGVTDPEDPMNRPHVRFDAGSASTVPFPSRRSMRKSLLCSPAISSRSVSGRTRTAVTGKRKGRYPPPASESPLGHFSCF